MHLVVDGYGGNPEKQKDPRFVYAFLERLPDTIGMTRITTPLVFTYRGVRPEDWGVTGVVIIAESHISVHTFPEHRYVNIDIFSCKEFDTRKALELVCSAFEFERVRTWELERGLEHRRPESALPWPPATAPLTAGVRGDDALPGP